MGEIMRIKNNYLLYNGASYYLGNSIKSFENRHYTEKTEEFVEKSNGILRFRYGPLTGGLMESHAWDVYTNGERIIKVLPVTGYKHRMIKFGDYVRSVMIAERIQGNFAVSHAISLLNAIESIEDIVPSENIIKIRMIASEMERIYNHLFLIVREMEAGSLSVAQYRFMHLYEKILRLNGDLFGHRFLFGLTSVNRITKPRLNMHIFLKKLDILMADFGTIIDILYNSRIMMDRLQTGYLTMEEAHNVTGPAARGSFLNVDDRTSYIEKFVPASGYIYYNGSALSRVYVRIIEIMNSAKLIEALISDEISCKCSRMVHRLSDNAVISRIESPSGDLVYAVEIDRDAHKIKKAAMRSSSALNIDGFRKSIIKNSIFTDFHFNFESFGIMIGELDAGTNFSI